MDFEFPSPILTSLILLPLLVLLIKNLQRSKATLSPKLPPGPGKLYMLFSILRSLIITPPPPHKSLRNHAKKHGGIMHLYLGEVSTVIISTPEFAKQILKTHDIAFANRAQTLFSKIISYNECNISFAPYGEYWRQMRKICTLGLFSAKMVSSFASIREDEVTNMMKFVQLAAGSSVNLTPEIFRYTNVVICRATVGKRYEDETTLVKLVHEMMSLYGGLDLVDLFPSNKFLHLFSTREAKIRKLTDRVEGILDAIIDEHVGKIKDKRNGEILEEEDLVDVLLRVKQQGGLQFPITSTNIKAIIMDMFIAGTDTAAVIIEWAMSEMLKNPIVMERAQSEVRQILSGKDTIRETDLKNLRYLKMVIVETLRLHPPAPFLLPSECREETIIHGYHIPVKSRVIINAWAINRDPEFWKDAEKFIPERFEEKEIEFVGQNMEFLTFGAGRRMCPGITFGMATTELALAKLLYHYNWELLDGMKPEEFDMSEEFSISLNRKNPLILIPTPYGATF